MNIVLKNSLKNIWGKPFRTLLVTFTIFMCCLSALLSFDIGNLIPRLLEGFYGNVSRADILVNSDGRDLTELPEGFPECDTMCLSTNAEALYQDIDGEYAFVSTDYFYIYGFDIDEGVDMEFIDSIELGANEMYISYDFATDFDYSVGDTYIVHDRADNEVELTVAGIFPEDLKNTVLSGYSAVVNQETSDTLSCGYRIADAILIDIADDSRIDEAKDLIKDQHPGLHITDLFINDSFMNMISQLELIFTLFFAATVLLVIFVTASICNRIVSERMSYIGTLRSFGMSSSATAGILLLENVLYAIMGAVPAAVIYTVVRNLVLSKVFGSDSAIGSLGFDIPPVSGALIAGVIIFAIVMECLIPLRAILKALKTSIRDIIFDNRDTQYKFSKKSLVAGIIFLVLSVLLAVFNVSLVTAIICLLTSIAALALLFPRVLKLVTTAVRKISSKNNNSRWELAAVETISRKSTVGSGVLCATAAAMCLIVLEVAKVLFGVSGEIPYQSDVLAECNSSAKYYSYVDNLEGVTDTEALYFTAGYVSINGDDSNTMAFIYGIPDGGYSYYSEFDEAPDNIPDDGVVLSSDYAGRRGISEGDVISITFDNQTLLPIERELRVTALVDFTNNGAENVLISFNTYLSIYHDRPAELLVCCDNPDTIKDTLKTYGKDMFTSVKTIEEYKAENELSSAAINAVVKAIIVVAVGMTAIGVTSNLLIGFEGRKKECAVLLSTAMDKKTLSGILFKEVLITSITASGLGVIVGTLFLNVLGKALASAEFMSLKIDVNYKMNLIFFVVLSIVFSLTVLFPIKNLKKMKISEQIKYE